MELFKRIWGAIGGWFARHRRFFFWLGAGTVAAGAAGVAAIAFLPQILGLFAPTLDLSKDLYAANRPIAIRFVDTAGDVVGRRGAIVGERLSLKQMPAYLPAAFIAMEDRSFWTNDGVDVRGLLRAAWLNMRAGHVVAGGSTITQQVAKIVFLTPERTFARKFEELLDAAALNKSLTKAQILELYLNRIYLGSGAYGVDGAAHVYFGTSARKLTLAQAAMLATLTRAPSVFSPRRDLAAAQRRARVVLRAMVETGAITKAQAQDAVAHPAKIVDRSVLDARNYYFDTAADRAKTLVSVNGKVPDSDLVVHTTFVPKIQEAARKAVETVLKKQGKKRKASEAAVVVMKPDGAVVALIGGRDYDESVFNRATLAHRQPGSAFKPFVYLAAMEQGISPWDFRTDQPVDINGWTPTNYGGEAFGTITVADALAHSVNTITAELAQEVGITNVMAAARRCGITSPLEPNASLALGTSEVTPLELTGAYAAFANGGTRATPYLVTEVDDAAGHVLYRRVPPAPKRAIARHVDRDMTAMLYQVVTDGTGRRAALSGREVGGKTGTTQDYHDAWFVGFTRDYVAGVWVGNDDSSPMKYVTGGSLPAEIWHATMRTAEHGLRARPLERTEPPVMFEEGTGLFLTAGGDTMSGFVDDEAPRVRERQGQPEEHRSFWDWLFGRDGPSADSRDRRTAPARRYPPETRAAPRDGRTRGFTPPETGTRGYTQPDGTTREYGTRRHGPDGGVAGRDPQAGGADNPDGYDGGQPRQIPKYHWRSDPRWQQVPSQHPHSRSDRDRREYGIDSGPGGN